MTGNYFTLKLLARELDPVLTGHRLTGLFSQERDELVLATDACPSHLVITCRHAENTLFLHPGYVRARSNTADLLTVAAGRNILAVRPDPADRAVTIHLEGSYVLLCLLFGARANVLLLDAQQRTVDSFRTTGAGESARRPSGPETPFFDVVALQELLGTAPDLPASRVVRQAFPQLGPDLVRELMHRCALQDDILAGAMSVSAVSRLGGAFGELLADLENPRPVVYGGAGESHLLFSPIPLQSLADRERREYDDIHEAVRYTVYRRRALLTADRERSGILDTLQREVARLDRTIEALDRELGEHERAGLYERYGALLLAHPDAVPRGASSVELSDGPTRHQIGLDPRISATRNAQRYFDRAKRARTARAEAVLRRPPLVERRALVLRLLEDVGQLRSREELKAYAAEHADRLTAFGIGPEARKREQIPFRIFTVDGGFQVWAGKSSENNDLLTLRHAKPNDLWFHARGAGGSHVVLRAGTGAGEPGKRARQQAASIAAYYSTMRTAGTVPVSMTRRKFVRKPRGAPAGTVVLEREDVLFVQPQLPPEDRPVGHTHRSGPRHH